MKKLGLFEAYGVELEYMIVDKSTLNVKPISDELIKAVSGKVQNEISRGMVSWSNELVTHVLEMKCTKPESDLQVLMQAFHENIHEASQILAQFDAMLMPTAAHPWMNPAIETKLWEHDQNDIYELYNRVFNCQGHGWANLQSTHINLPFANEEEFGKLHAAIRLILPLLPALAASSPILDMKTTGFVDTRLHYYEKNQRVLPALTGKVIPEQAFNKNDYKKLIYNPIAKAIAPFDQNQITEPVWLNSRGAIARFDRGAIEIRILDIQESPLVDLTIVQIVTELLKLIVAQRWVSTEAQMQWSHIELYPIYHEAVKYGENGLILNAEYCKLFGMDVPSITFSKLWVHILETISSEGKLTVEGNGQFLEAYSKNGTLASRIIKSLDKIETPQNIKLIYSELCDTLKNNEVYQG
jgi:carboxylate-amine ligase